MKIAVTGCAGLGKTVLAKLIAKRLGLNVVLGTAQEVLQQANPCWSEMTCHVESFIESCGLRQEIFELQKRNEAQSESFVTDRAYVEQAAYIIVEGSRSFNDHGSDKLISKCIEESKKYDVIVYMSYDGFDLKDKKSMYKYVVDSVILRLLDKITPCLTKLRPLVVTISSEKIKRALKLNDLSHVADEVIEFMLLQKAIDPKQLKPRLKRPAARSSVTQKRVPGRRLSAR
jgi:predicted ATPase